MAFGGENAESYYDEGLTALMKGDVAHAEEYFTRAIQMDRTLVVGESLGAVPDAVPMVPLAADLARRQKALRLTPSANSTTLQLDLRKDTHRERSLLFHRLLLIEVPWARPADSASRKNRSLISFIDTESVSSSNFKVLIATCRLILGSLPRYTIPMAPRPNSFWIS